MTKDIGYELRCADPIPFDMEYTRDLGYCAAQYALDGGTDAMVTLVNGRFEPVPFSQMLDPQTGRTRVYGWWIPIPSSTRSRVDCTFVDLAARISKIQKPSEASPAWSARRLRTSTRASVPGQRGRPTRVADRTR